MAELSGAAQARVSSVVERAAAGAKAGSGWVIFILSLVALIAAVDRQAFSVLLVPIQKDLKVSDTAMGALTGASFAVVYALAALPLARLADRTNRRNLLAIAMSFWSLATVLCGLSVNYVQLLLSRIGVAGAESAYMPSILSLVADSFPARKRGGAIGFVIVGSAIGFSLGSFLAGVLAQQYNWHVALLVVGAPGLLLSLVMFLTVREPKRGAYDGPAEHAAQPLSLLECLKRCARIRTLYPFALGFICLNTCYQGWLIWAPAFLMRVHHLNSGQMGAVFGVIVAGGAVGNLVSGRLSDRLARRGARWRLYVCAALVVLSVPLLTAASFVDGLPAVFACLLAYSLVSGGLTTASAVSYISVAPANMRAFVTAIMLVGSQIIGGGAGPVVMGWANDLLKPTYGDQSLRYALLIAPAMMAVAGVLFLVSSRFIERDVANVASAADPKPA
ncbi:MAG: transporter [Phenylobacterium sp.]|nr:transporter [Phenylobacterium sp.]